MSDPGDDYDGTVQGSIPPPSWVPAHATPETADEWVAAAESEPSNEADPSAETDPLAETDALAEADTPASPRVDRPAPLVGVPGVAWENPPVEGPGAEEAVAEHLEASPFVTVPDEPILPEAQPELEVEPMPEIESPFVVEAQPAPDPDLSSSSSPEPVTVPAQSQPTPTAFETVTDPTFTIEPEPAVADAAEPLTPGASARITAITAEHPEFVVVAALIGGFILAKVVKKLAF